jgi:hypothetical protein
MTGTADKSPPIMPTPASYLTDLLDRMRMEYVEMPDLVLTGRQARRLWNLDAELCDMALAVLVHEEFLRQRKDGAFLRREQMSPSCYKEFTRDFPPSGPESLPFASIGGRMFSISLRHDEHVRVYSIFETAGLGWEMKLEEDREVTRRVRYHDWHRVERALSRIRLEVSALAECGWSVQGPGRWLPDEAPGRRDQ